MAMSYPPVYPRVEWRDDVATLYLTPNVSHVLTSEDAWRVLDVLDDAFPRPPRKRRFQPQYTALSLQTPLVIPSTDELAAMEQDVRDMLAQMCERDPTEDP
jgi:hypothetical protein